MPRTGSQGAVWSAPFRANGSRVCRGCGALIEHGETYRNGRADPYADEGFATEPYHLRCAHDIAAKRQAKAEGREP